MCVRFRPPTPHTCHFSPQRVPGSQGPGRCPCAPPRAPGPQRGPATRRAQGSHGSSPARPYLAGSECPLLVDKSGDVADVPVCIWVKPAHARHRLHTHVHAHGHTGTDGRPHGSDCPTRLCATCAGANRPRRTRPKRRPSGVSCWNAWLLARPRPPPAALQPPKGPRERWASRHRPRPV